MRSSEYLIKALNGGAYRHKVWVFECFSKVIEKSSDNYPFKLEITGKQYSFLNPETNELEVIEDSDSSKQLFTFLDTIDLPAGSVPNLKEDITTTAGQLLVNMIALVHPFGDKIDYVNGPFKIGSVESQISKRLTTDVKYQDKKSFKPDAPIYVSEYLEFINSITAIEGFSQLCVPSASPRSLSTDPKIEQRKKELLEKHAHELDDPRVIANIEAELVAMDKEWLKGDISEGFFVKDKQFGEARKKMHIMYGVQTGFGVTSHLATKGLDDGWDGESMAGMVNALREASYARGKGTAMGGYETKIVNRMFQNISVTEDDCGTTLGWDIEVTKDNFKELIGFYRIDSKGKAVLVTEDDTNLIGKKLSMRSAQFCKTKGNGFCKKCIGFKNSENENALSANIAEVTSRLMLLQMKKMHNTSIKNTIINLDCIS